MAAAYRKYPNPHSTSVKTLDTLERSSTASEIYSHRLFSTMWNIPNLVQNVSKNYQWYIWFQTIQRQILVAPKRFNEIIRRVSV